MGRQRTIHPADDLLWLGVLLDAAFDATSHQLNLARRAEELNRPGGGKPEGHGWSPRIARSELLAIASDLTDYPDDYPPARRAELLLRWAERWLDDDAWRRLAARVRKRRSRTVAKV